MGSSTGCSGKMGYQQVTVCGCTLTYLCSLVVVIIAASEQVQTMNPHWMQICLVPSGPVWSSFLAPFSNNCNHNWSTIVEFLLKPGPDPFSLVNSGPIALFDWLEPVKPLISQ